MSYEVFSRYYDEITGVPEARIELVERLIGGNAPGAEKVLEIGCGTGQILDHFSNDYEVWGLDISEEMLEVARKKVPEGHFFFQDMKDFNLGDRFDVVLCVYDSINHLLDFDEWERAFERVEEHLSEGGIFIMDYNTPERLEEIAERSCDLHEVGDDFLVVTTEKWDRGAEWTFQVFEKRDGNCYVLKMDSIKESSYPVSQVREALERHFGRVEIMNEEGDTPSDPTERVYFLCEY